MNININSFSRQVSSARHRIAQLLHNASDTPAMPHHSFTPVAFKELGVVTEELEVATEELRQQNEELLYALESAHIMQDRYHELFDFSPDAYVVTSLEGCIQEVNQAANQLFGLAGNFLIGKPLPLFVAESDRQMFRIRLLQVQQSQSPQEWRFHWKLRDGQEFQAICRTMVIRRGQELVGIHWRIQPIKTAQLETPPGDRFVANSPESESIQTFSRGDLISLDPQSVYLIQSGFVKLTTLTDSNEEIMVGLVGPDIPFGSYLTALPLYQAAAMSEVQLVALPVLQLEVCPQLAQQFLAKVNRKFRQVEILLMVAGQRRVIDRLRLFLDFLKEEIGEPVPQGTRLLIRLTHEEIASACCTTRVTITRMFNQLQKEGKFTLDKTGHIILF